MTPMSFYWQRATAEAKKRKAKKKKPLTKRKTYGKVKE